MGDAVPCITSILSSSSSSNSSIIIIIIVTITTTVAITPFGHIPLVITARPFFYCLFFRASLTHTICTSAKHETNRPTCERIV